MLISISVPFINHLFTFTDLGDPLITEKNGEVNSSVFAYYGMFVSFHRLSLVRNILT